MSNLKQIVNTALFAISLGGFIVSCQSKRSIYLHVLTSDSFKYWKLVPVGEGPKFYGYCLNKNFNYDYYVNNYDGRRIKCRIYYRTIWDIVDDSTIMIGEGLYYRIASVNPDTVELKSLKTNQSKMLIRESNQTIKAVEDTTTYAFPNM